MIEFAREEKIEWAQAFRADGCTVATICDVLGLSYSFVRYWTNETYRAEKLVRDRHRQQTEAFRIRNRERYRERRQSAEYRAKARERDRVRRLTTDRQARVQERAKERYANDPAFREKQLESVRRRKQTAEYREYLRRQYEANPQYRLAYCLRSRLHNALRRYHRGSRAGSAVRDCGCTMAELVAHLESLWLPGMSWGNHGDWHIDHKKPLAAFDLTDRAQFLEACHFTNLQPLWAVDNLRKGAREVI